jgi:GT2 family glycosyltransferase
LAEVCAIVLNWNGGERLERCLRSLLTQAGARLRVIVCDNASTDGSVGSAERLKAEGHPLELLRFDRNLGYSRAFNVAIERAGSEFVLCCNYDIAAQPDFLRRLVGCMTDPEVGSACGKLLRPASADSTPIIDSAGIGLNRYRRPWDRGANEPDQGQFDEPGEVFCSCGALPLYRREMLEDIKIGREYFDEDFFAYCEDVDLGWRARLRGWKSVFVPQAVAYHARGGANALRSSSAARASDGGDLRFQTIALRNRYLMLIKNERPLDMLADLPWLAGYELARFVYLMTSRPRLLPGLFSWIPLAERALRKRKAIQARATTPRQEMRRWLMGSGTDSAGRRDRSREASK